VVLEKERIGRKKTKEKEDNTIRHVTLVFGEDKGERKGQLMLHLMVRKEKKKNIYIYIYIEHEAHVLRGRSLKEKVEILLLDCYADMMDNKTK
jgi:hypothetical protein